MLASISGNITEEQIIKMVRVSEIPVDLCLFEFPYLLPQDSRVSFKQANIEQILKPPVATSLKLRTPLKAAALYL